MTQISSLSDILEIEKTPLAAHSLPQSTFAMLQQGAAIDPEAPALHWFLQAKGKAFTHKESYSFREMLGHIRQTANFFHSLGVDDEDVVSFILPNMPETHWTIWGAECAGIVNPINPLLEPQQIADILIAAGTKVLVTLAPFPKTDLWDKVDSIREQVPTLETIVRVHLADHLKGMTKHTIKLMGRKKIQNIEGQDVIDFNKGRSSFPKDRLIFERDIEGDHIASYFHTGGTTGLPKLAAHTHSNEVYNAWAMMQFLGTESGTGKNFFCALPLFHVNGVFVTGLAPWSIGATVTLGPPQGYRTAGLLANFWKIVEHYQLTFFSGVPTVFSKLLDVPVGNADISSLEYAICGAAPMPVEVFKNFEQKSGVRILEGYGCTEGTCASSINPPFGERKVGSIGLRFPHEEMKVAILDEVGKFERNARIDEIGAVILRGPNVFDGYKEDFHNQHIWIDDGDGKGEWYNTGDLGRQDAEGYFWLTGRKKEIIIRGGHNIDPRMIEEPMHKHPAVALVAAVGSPDAKVGEVPVIFVQLKAGHQATGEELYHFAQEHIAERAAWPQAIHILEEMPVTPIGKVHKLPLMMGEIERVLERELSKVPVIERVETKIVSDRKYGLLAEVTITPKKGANIDTAKKEAENLLGLYTVRSSLFVK